MPLIVIVSRPFTEPEVVVSRYRSAPSPITKFLLAEFKLLVTRKEPLFRVTSVALGVVLVISRSARFKTTSRLLAACKLSSPEVPLIVALGTVTN